MENVVISAASLFVVLIKPIQTAKLRNSLLSGVQVALPVVSTVATLLNLMIGAYTKEIDTAAIIGGLSLT